MDLDLRLVRYFVAVADELHFGRAAAGLYVSQPSLSRQIRRLEDHLGTPLLVRDSRHVSLTPFGQRFLADARQLLILAERMQQPADPGAVRIAHIHELDTSRQVADAFTAVTPGVRVVERVLDSTRQLDALLEDQLDVAVLRVTPAMLAAHPSGWSHRLLRLEPLRLVGRPGDPSRGTVSLYERPLEVFADATGSGLYNTHGDYLTAFEAYSGLSLRWLGNPGAFSHCLTNLLKADGSAYLLEFDSYAARYAETGLPVYEPEELQPCYPWSLAWRDGSTMPAMPAVSRFLDIAVQTSEKLDWLAADGFSTGRLWLPETNPVELPAATRLPDAQARQ